MRERIDQKETIQKMLKILEDGHGIATAGSPIIDGFPSMQALKSGEQDRDVYHMGFGFFRGFYNGKEFDFNGGGAMEHGTLNGDSVSWTAVTGSKECLKFQGINIKNQIKTLKELKNGNIKQ